MISRQPGWRFPLPCSERRWGGANQARRSLWGRRRREELIMVVIIIVMRTAVAAVESQRAVEGGQLISAAAGQVNVHQSSGESSGGLEVI